MSWLPAILLSAAVCVQGATIWMQQASIRRLNERVKRLEALERDARVLAGLER